jgi:hypothetical protein
VVPGGLGVGGQGTADGLASHKAGLSGLLVEREQLGGDDEEAACAAMSAPRRY